MRPRTYVASLVAIAAFVALVTGATFWPTPVEAQTPALRTLISAQSALDSTGTVTSASRCKEKTVYIQWSAGVSAGVVILETASVSTYAGTWAPLVTIPWTAASKEDVVQVSGVMMTLRTRISTVITGGTVTTTFVCN